MVELCVGCRPIPSLSLCAGPETPARNGMSAGPPHAQSARHRSAHPAKPAPGTRTARARAAQLPVLAGASRPTSAHREKSEFWPGTRCRGLTGVSSHARICRYWIHGICAFPLSNPGRDRSCGTRCSVSASPPQVDLGEWRINAAAARPPACNCTAKAAKVRVSMAKGPQMHPVRVCGISAHGAHACAPFPRSEPRIPCLSTPAHCRPRPAKAHRLK